MTNTDIRIGNVFDELPKIPENSIDLVLTSPPYWQMRDYQIEGQLGNEPTMEAYLDNTLIWVKEVWRVLKPTGSFVLNIGDCFIGGGKGGYESKTSIMPRVNASVPNAPSWADLKKNGTRDWKANSSPNAVGVGNLGGIYKTKQLLSVSSFAYCRIISETDFVCRGEHIWAKPNVPSPIRSRLKHSHEKLFWFVKDADKNYFEKGPWMKKTTTTKERCAYPTNLMSDVKSGEKSNEKKKLDVIDETIEHSWRIIPVGAKQTGFELHDKPASEHITPFPEELIRPYIKSLAPPPRCCFRPLSRLRHYHARLFGGAKGLCRHRAKPQIR